MAPGGEPTAALMDEPEESSAGDVGHSARDCDDGGGGVRSESVNGDKNGGSEAMKPGGGDKNGGEGMRGLRRYKMMNMVGDGTYGLVYLAHNLETRDGQTS